MSAGTIKAPVFEPVNIARVVIFLILVLFCLSSEKSEYVLLFTAGFLGALFIGYFISSESMLTLLPLLYFVPLPQVFRAYILGLFLVFYWRRLQSGIVSFRIYHVEFLSVIFLTVLYAILTKPLNSGYLPVIDNFILPILLFHIVVNQDWTEKKLRTLWTVFAMVSMVMGIISFYRAFIIKDTTTDRIYHFIPDMAMFAAFNATMVIFGIGLHGILEKSESKRVLLMSIFFSAVAVFASGTRGVFNALCISLVYLLFRLNVNRQADLFKVFILLAITGAVGVALIPSDISTRYLTTLSYSKDASALGRFEAWLVVFLVLKENWLFGAGIGNFQVYFEELSPVQVAGVLNHEHNIILHLCFSIGVVGAAAYTGFFLKTLWAMRRAPLQEKSTSATKHIRIAIETFFLMLLITGMTDVYINFLYYAAFVWLILGLGAVASSGILNESKKPLALNQN